MSGLGNEQAVSSGWRVGTADAGEAGRAAACAQLLGRAGAAAAHGEEVEAEIGVADGSAPAVPDIGSAISRVPSGGQRAARCAQEGQRRLVVMVVDDPDQRDDVRTLRQRIGDEVAAERRGARRQPGRLEAGRRPLGHRRQIEQHQAQIGRACRGGGQEAAFAAADVEQAAMPRQRIGVQDCRSATSGWEAAISAL